MEHARVDFVPLLIVISLAFLVPLVLSRMKRAVIPIVVGEIAAGILVGTSGLHLVEQNIVLEILSDLGFAYLMFLSGLEIEFSSIVNELASTDGSQMRRWLNNPFAIGGSVFSLTLIGSTISAFFLRGLGLINDVWIMALILSTTSLGVVVPVLKERGLSGDNYSQSILVSSLIADFATILLISIYVLLRSEGLTLEILLVLVLFLAFVIVYRLARLFQRHLPAERVFEELSSATSQIKLRGSFALALIFIALAESLGIENILGAFLAGVIISLLSEGEGSILREKLDAIGYGFFIPIFFIMVGVRFDLPALLSSNSALLLLPLLLGIAYIVKLAPSLIYRFKYSWRETFGAGMILSSRLSLIIAAAAIGLEMGAISEAINSEVILIAVITCTVSPIFFNRLVPRAIRDEPDRMIIVGSQNSAALLVNWLRRHDQEAILICRNQDQHAQALAMGIPSICSDKVSLETQPLSNVLQQAEIQQAKAVIAMEENDEDNLRICRMARRMYGIDNVVSWVRDPKQNDRFRQLGVRVVNPAYSTVLIMASLALSEEAISMTSDMDEAQEVREIKLQNRNLVGRSVRDLMLPGDVVILMIERSGDIVIPDRHSVLQANDIVTLVGNDGEVDSAARFLSRTAAVRHAS